MSITQPNRRAAQILAAAQVAFEQSEEFIEPLHRIEHERAEKAARITLGDADFASAWEEGKQMPLEQAIAYALEEYDG